MNDYTIVFTCYNDEENITGFFENLKEQTILPKQIIMVDGGSIDSTVDIAKSIAKDSVTDISIVAENKRLNISEGLNLAIKKSTTEYIGIAGIGNKYEKDHFETLLNAIRNLDVEITYSPIWGAGKTKFNSLYNKILLNGDKGTKQSIPSNHSALINKNVFSKIGYFYENFVYAGEDTEFYLRAQKNGIRSQVVENAKMVWYTPETETEYFKQIKNYTIADMQLKKNKTLMFQYKKSIIFLLFLLLILISMFFKNLFFLSITLFVLAWVFLYIKYTKKWGKGSFRVCFMRDFGPLFVIITNIKYLFKKNKIKLDLF